MENFFFSNQSGFRQKRWAIKGGKTYYGYKNHVNIDAKNKVIRSYKITSAANGDKAELEKLLSTVPRNENKVWADGAYFSEEQEARLKQAGYISRIKVPLSF